MIKSTFRTFLGPFAGLFYFLLFPFIGAGIALVQAGRASVRAIRVFLREETRNKASHKLV